MAGIAAEQSTGQRAPWANRAGSIGLVLLLFAIFRFTLRESWDTLSILPGAAGAAGIASWAVARRASLIQRVRTRGVRYGWQTLVVSLLLLAVVVLVNFIAARHNRSFDLTESSLFSLSAQTKQVLHALDRDVKLRAFFPAGRRAQAADLLRRYADETRHLHYELIDPDQDPDEAQRNGVTAYGTVVLQGEPKAGAPAPKPVRVEAESTGRGLSLSEEKLTNGLIKLARTGVKTIYFLEGHGEGDVNSPQLNGYTRVRGALENQAFVVKPLFLAGKPQVPGDCSVLIIAGPGQEPQPEEIKAIDNYLQSGGKAFVLIDPPPGASMQHFLDSWGFDVKPDLVVDLSGEGRLYKAGPAMPLVKDYNHQHPVTRDFRLMTFFPLARSVFPKMRPGDASIQALAETSPESFAEPYDGISRRARFDPKKDKRGPIPLVGAATREAQNGKQARIVVAGSSNFVSNAFFDKSGNADLFLNCANWLAEETELIAIRPRPRLDHRVQLTDQQARGIFWLTVVALPAAALVVGGVVFWRRR